MTSPTASSTRSVSLLLRLWGRADGGNVTPRWAWNDGNQLTLMLCQAVTLGGGVPQEANSEDGLLRAKYVDEFHAARTARQIQALVTGFAGVAEQPASGVIVAIIEAADSAEEECNPVGLRTYLEQRAQPAQIFFASLSEKSSSLTAYFPTRPVAELGPPQQRYQLHELLWSHKEEAAAAAFKAAAQWKATPSESTTLPSGSGRKRLAKRGSSLRDEVTSRFHFARETGAAALRDVVVKTGPGTQRFLRSRHLPFIAAGVLTLFFGAILLIHHHSKPSPKGNVEPVAKVVTPPTGIKAESAAPLPSTREQKSAHSLTPDSPDALTKGLLPTPKPSLPHPPERPKKPQPSEEPERSARSRGEFSPEQTRQILSRGQVELDRGCYGKAIDYYRRVIEDDPSNSLANGGIDKARKRMQLDRQVKPLCQ